MAPRAKESFFGATSSDKIGVIVLIQSSIGECYNYTVKVNLENKITNFCELPLTLTVADVARVLGVSKQNASRLCHSKGFPCIQVGKRLIIPRPAFEKWMQNPFIFESEEKLHG